MEVKALKAKVASPEDERKEKDMTISELRQQMKALKLKTLSTDKYEEWGPDELVHWIVDIKRWGVINFKHSKRLLREIKALVLSAQQVGNFLRQPRKAQMLPLRICDFLRAHLAVNFRLHAPPCLR